MSDHGEPGTPPPHRTGAGGTRNRKWLIIIGATPVLVAIIAAAVYLTGPTEPSVGLTPPAGYRAVADAYYAYAIPGKWKQDSSGTDNNGDLYYRGPGGWVGETLRLQGSSPPLGEAAPLTLAAFGQPRPTPYRLTSGARFSVPGTDAAWSYELLRPGVAPVRVVDAWVRASRTEIWLVISADSPQTATIAASLRA